MLTPQPCWRKPRFWVALALILTGILIPVIAFVG